MLFLVFVFSSCLKEISKEVQARKLINTFQKYFFLKRRKKYTKNKRNLKSPMLFNNEFLSFQLELNSQQSTNQCSHQILDFTLPYLIMLIVYDHYKSLFLYFSFLYSSSSIITTVVLPNNAYKWPPKPIIIVLGFVGKNK